VNMLPLTSGEKIVEVIATKDYGGGRFLVTASRNGLVKKTKFELYNTARRDGIIALDLAEGDEMIRARLTSGNSELVLISEGGQSIKFSERDCRPMGRTARGVKGMNLASEDHLLTMEVPDEGADVFVITANGFGKRTSAGMYPLQKRGGKGVRTIKLTEVKGSLAGARVVRDNQELFVVSQEGIIIRVPVNGIPRTGRATQGVRVMRVQENDLVSAVALVVSGDDRAGDEAGEDEEYDMLDEPEETEDIPEEQ
jgi:DNA gyrase subunit A